MQLLWGWSVWGRYLIEPIAGWTGWPQTKAYLAMSTFVAFAALVPIIWILYRVARWNRLAGPSTTVEKR
jgi:hypothetical protein